jgi:hypothetical protein
MPEPIPDDPACASPTPNMWLGALTSASGTEPASEAVKAAWHGGDTATCPHRWHGTCDVCWMTAALAAAAPHIRAPLEAEVKRLTRERDLAVAHDQQPYPTADAYEAACRALEKHRQRADVAEAEVKRLRALVGEEDQPGWNGCSRAEAIRQADWKHDEYVRMCGLFEQVKAERDEARAHLAEAEDAIGDYEAAEPPMIGTVTAEEIASVNYIADTHFDAPELYLTEEADDGTCGQPYPVAHEGRPACDRPAGHAGHENGAGDFWTEAYDLHAADERTRILAAITDPERYAAWCQAAWDDGQHIVQAAPSVLAGVAKYVAAVAGDDGTIPCQVYRMGPHGKRLCVRAINEAPPCCFPASDRSGT